MAMEIESKCNTFFDDDGRPKRTGNLITASSHIITAVIGSGVLSLAWAIGQLGWIAGPAMMISFALITVFTSCLQSDCYRTGDPVHGKRNYTYMEAVRSILGGINVKFCGIVQYVNLVGVCIGYTIAASISMMAIQRSNCYHSKGHANPCRVDGNAYMIVFGVFEILLSHIPNFDQLSWLSILAAVMSFTYSTIGLLLGILQVSANKTVKGSLTGISVGEITEAQKIWRSLQALGNIAFAYSFSNILLEIQDTLRSPPSEVKTMKKAMLISVTMTTVFYMACGCFGYAAFGDLAPGNLLTGFGFYNPYWLVDIANLAIVIHLVGAYQVFAQPIFACVEENATDMFTNSSFITKEIQVQVPCSDGTISLCLFRSVWRTIFVILTTLVAMLLPFFDGVVGILGAIGFWPLTVYFPVEMYIVQKKVPMWSKTWVRLKLLSYVALLISICAVVGSIAGLLDSLKQFKPFKTVF